MKTMIQLLPVHSIRCNLKRHESESLITHGLPRLSTSDRRSKQQNYFRFVTVSTIHSRTNTDYSVSY